MVSRFNDAQTLGNLNYSVWHAFGAIWLIQYTANPISDGLWTIQISDFSASEASETIFFTFSWYHTGYQNNSTRVLSTVLNSPDTS